MYINRKINDAQDLLEKETREFLILNGWEYKCLSPGSIWLWCKKYVDFTYALSSDEAVILILRDTNQTPKGLDPEDYEEEEQQ